MARKPYYPVSVSATTCPGDYFADSRYSNFALTAIHLKNERTLIDISLKRTTKLLQGVRMFVKYKL